MDHENAANVRHGTTYRKTTLREIEEDAHTRESGGFLLKSSRSVLLIVVGGLALTACAPTGNPLVGESLAQQPPAGFLLGV